MADLNANAPGPAPADVRPKRRGVAAFFGANAVAQMSALVRYVVLARLLGPEELGVATILTVAWAFFQAITDSGVERFIVQNRNGDDPEVQNLLHGANLLRGLVGCLGLLAVALPLAAFYEKPELAVGLALLSLVPLAIGFVHTDMRRRQRRHDFKTEARATATAEIVSLVCIVVAALVLRNHYAVALALLARALVLVIASHQTAERPFRVAWHRGHAIDLARFSLPLMGASSLGFFSSQGDRALVSGFATLEQLGHYSAVMLLIYYPTQSLNATLTVLQLPSLSEPRDAERRVAADRFAALCVLLTACFAVGFAVVAPIAVPLFFGEEFRTSLLLVALVGALQSLRFLYVWPWVTILGRGKSHLILAGAVLKLAGFGLAFLAGLAWRGAPDVLVYVLAAFFAGEALALSVFLTMADRVSVPDLARRSQLRLVRVVGLLVAT